MSYDHKTYVAFASENIGLYRLMRTWKASEHAEFHFFDAHDLHLSQDGSTPDARKRQLRDRLVQAKQVVYLAGSVGHRNNIDSASLLTQEIELIMELNLPVVVSNLDQDRSVKSENIPKQLRNRNYFTMSVSYQSKIIMFALDDYVVEFNKGLGTGPHCYKPAVYASLGM